MELIEVPDAPEPAHASPGADAQVLRIEGERLLAKIRPDDYVIALAIDGKSYTSVGFAEHVEKVMLKGRMVFVIGGSLGLSPEVYARANERISFGTDFSTSDDARDLSLEQARSGACRIQAKEPYHK